MHDTPQVYSWKDRTLPPNAPALQIYFLQEPQVNAEATEKTGVQTYDNVIVGYVSPMGMPKSNVALEMERQLPDGTVKVHQINATKYAEPLSLFKKGIASESTGTPLRDLVGITPAIIMTMKAKGIHTVEMLADMPDAAGQDLMGFWEWREKARKHIEHREKNAPMVKLEAIEERHKKEIADLQQQVHDLTAILNKKKPKSEAA